MDNKDVRFTDKKIDDSWKEQIAKDKGSKTEEAAPTKEDRVKHPPTTSPAPATSKVFLNFITSLGYQAMMQLGEIPNPETSQPETNLDAAREIIDLLIHLNEKTKGNLSSEEQDFFSGVLPELQLHFTRKS
jgi:hypothetical protein